MHPVNNKDISVLSLFKKEKPFQNEALSVYTALLEHIKNPVFYNDYKVPDTLDGRFDILTLHVFAVMYAVGSCENAKVFNQALFDVMFSDIDQMLRQMGIGDMGIPKRMRRMMTAFNGRVHAYKKAISNSTQLKDAIQRNIYSAAPLSNEGTLVTTYILDTIKIFQAHSEDILNGNITLP